MVLFRHLIIQGVCLLTIEGVHFQICEINNIESPESNQTNPQVGYDV